MLEKTIEISVKGQWIRVPAVQFEDKTITVRGRWIRQAEVSDEEWLETELRDPALCVDTLKAQRKSGFAADVFTFAQKLPHIVPKYDFPITMESVAAINITTFDQWWEALPQETRKNVRRAQKRGVTIELKQLDDDLVRDLKELNDDSAVRQGKAYTHYGKTIDQIRKDQESFPDRRELICAYHGTELVGFLKLIYRDDVASILQFLPKASHSDKRPANALLAKAVEICASKNISYLTYGKLTYGNKYDSLREFKIRNGFQDILVPRYYVPLTWRGTLWTSCELYRGVLGILSPRMIAFALRVRGQLRNMTLSSTRSMSSDKPV